MAPIWSRALLFPEETTRSAPMWDRPAAGGLISLEPIAASSPMWNRPAASVPIFEEAVPSPSHMWSRDPTGVAVCPCCVSAVPVAPRPTSRRSSGGSSGSSGGGRRSGESLRSMPSSIGLRIKSSFAQLRKRPSQASL